MFYFVLYYYTDLCARKEVYLFYIVHTCPGTSSSFVGVFYVFSGDISKEQPKTNWGQWKEFLAGWNATGKQSRTVIHCNTLLILNLFIPSFAPATSSIPAHLCDLVRNATSALMPFSSGADTTLLWSLLCCFIFTSSCRILNKKGCNGT